MLKAFFVCFIEKYSWYGWVISSNLTITPESLTVWLHNTFYKKVYLQNGMQYQYILVIFGTKNSGMVLWPKNVKIKKREFFHSNHRLHISTSSLREMIDENQWIS